MFTKGKGGELKDTRLEKRAALLLRHMTKNVTALMHQTDNWSELIAYYRFFNNEKVTEEALIRSATGHCAAEIAGLKEIVLIEDTTELNLEKKRARIKDKEGLGEVGNGTDLGFFCHPSIAVNPQDWSLIGVADMYLMKREREKNADGSYKERTPNEPRALPTEEKESYRWIERAISARKALSGVEKVTVIQDIEGGIYESFHLLGEAGVDFVIRSAHNLMISETGAPEGKIEEHFEGLSQKYRYELELGGYNKKRLALMELRYSRVKPALPANRKGKGHPDAHPVWVVQAKENAETVPAEGEPIEWLLYTSHPVESAGDAEKIIKYYKSRWMIEDLFRILKSEGLNYEESELPKGKSIRRLFVMAFIAAIQILQMRQARSGTTG
jgi:hypothetical protein